MPIRDDICCHLFHNEMLLMKEHHVGSFDSAVYCVCYLIFDLQIANLIVSLFHSMAHLTSNIILCGTLQASTVHTTYRFSTRYIKTQALSLTVID